MLYLKTFAGLVMAKMGQIYQRHNETFAYFYIMIGNGGKSFINFSFHGNQNFLFCYK